MHALDRIRASRRLAAAGVATVLGFAVAIAGAIPAHAADLPVITPINQLPSTIGAGVGGYTPPVAGGQMYLYAQLYRAVTTPGQADALRAQSAGAALTTSQTAALAAAPKPRIPVAATAALQKVGTAGAVLSTLSTGWELGNAGLQLFGVDTKGLACQADEGDGFASLIYGQSHTSCNTAAEYPAEYVKNADAGLIPSNTICAPSGACMTLVQLDRVYVNGSYLDRLCFQGTDPVRYTGQYASGATYTTDPGTSSADQWSPPYYPSVQACGTPLVSLPFTPSGNPALVAIGPAGQTPDPINYQPADPQRVLRCVVLGSDGQTYTGVSDPFTEATSTTLPQPKCADLPAGVWPKHVTLSDEIAGGGTGSVLYDSDTTDAYQRQMTAYPECAGGACLLDLRKNGTTCFDGTSSCADWFAATDQGTNARDYSCSYGTHAVALSECAVYAPTFTPQNVQKGSTQLADPAQPSTDPAPNPGAAPSPAPGGASDPDPSGSCWGSAWGDWNPLTWVLLPVKCALTWAFVPRQSVIDSTVGTLPAELDASPPGKVLAAINTFELPAAPTGCGGLLFDTSWIGTVGHISGIPANVRVFAACPGDPLHPYAVASSLFLSVGTILLGVRALARLTGRFGNFGGTAGE